MAASGIGQGGVPILVPCISVPCPRELRLRGAHARSGELESPTLERRDGSTNPRAPPLLDCSRADPRLGGIGAVYIHCRLPKDLTALMIWSIFCTRCVLTWVADRRAPLRRRHRWAGRPGTAPPRPLAGGMPLRRGAFVGGGGMQCRAPARMGAQGAASLNNLCARTAAQGRGAGAEGRFRESAGPAPPGLLKGRS